MSVSPYVRALVTLQPYILEITLSKAGLRFLNEATASAMAAIMVWKSKQEMNPLGVHLFSEKPNRRNTRLAESKNICPPVHCSAWVQITAFQPHGKSMEHCTRTPNSYLSGHSKITCAKMGQNYPTMILI